MSRAKTTAQGPRYSGWLLFLYKVPAKPVNNRMKIWRRLNRSGAIQFKGSAYLLPGCDDHHEFFSWLITEIESLGGEAALIRTDRVENMDDAQLVYLFDRQCEKQYETSSQATRNLTGAVQSACKGGTTSVGTVKRKLDKAQKEFKRIFDVDFFASKTGTDLQSDFETLRQDLSCTVPTQDSRHSPIVPRKKKDYQNKTWVTRPKPFVDRMATAWLITKFIDPTAQFKFAREHTQDLFVENKISFDMPGATLTHVGELCTFEVVVASFGIKDQKIGQIARIVHDLDVKDDKYASDEAKGLENILTGIRNTAGSDAKILEKGMDIFEMLHASMN